MSWYALHDSSQESKQIRGRIASLKALGSAYGRLPLGFTHAFEVVMKNAR